MNDRTLDEVDPPAWSDAPADATNLVRRCHELRRKAIGEFTVEDMRMMIGQRIGLPYLVPQALDLLASDPLASGDLFPGDLLEAVLRVDGSYWTARPAERTRLSGIVATLVPMDADVRAAVEAFQADAS